MMGRAIPFRLSELEAWRQTIHVNEQKLGKLAHADDNRDDNIAANNLALRRTYSAARKEMNYLRNPARLFAVVCSIRNQPKRTNYTTHKATHSNDAQKD